MRQLRYALSLALGLFLAAPVVNAPALADDTPQLLVDKSLGSLRAVLSEKGAGAGPHLSEAGQGRADRAGPCQGRLHPGRSGRRRRVADQGGRRQLERPGLLSGDRRQHRPASGCRIARGAVPGDERFRAAEADAERDEARRRRQYRHRHGRCRRRGGQHRAIRRPTSWSIRSRRACSVVAPSKAAW